MSKVILYKTPEGDLAIVIPTDEILQNYTVEQVARKDVPAGLPYKIIDRSELPSDRTFRDAWDIAESELTDGIGSESNEF